MDSRDLDSSRSSKSSPEPARDNKWQISKESLQVKLRIRDCRKFETHRTLSFKFSKSQKLLSIIEMYLASQTDNLHRPNFFQINYYMFLL